MTGEQRTKRNSENATFSTNSDLSDSERRARICEERIERGDVIRENCLSWIVDGSVSPNGVIHTESGEDEEPYKWNSKTFHISKLEFVKQTEAEVGTNTTNWWRVVD